ncbi:MAG: ATP-binding protein [Pseudomonadota bacterium]
MFIPIRSLRDSSRRNFLLFCIALLLCVAALIYFLVHSNQKFNQVGARIQENNQIIAKTEELSTNLEAMISNYLSYLILEEGKHLKEYNTRTDSIGTIITELALLTEKNESQGARVKDLRQNYTLLLDRLDLQIDQATAEQQIATRDILRTTENIDFLKNKIMSIHSSILQEESQMLKYRFAQLAHQKDVYFLILVIGCVAAAVLLIIFNLFLMTAQSRRLLAESELRDKEERFKLAIEGMNDGVYDWDLESDQVFYSGQFFQMLGYDRGDTEGTIEDFKDLVHPDDQERVWEYIAHYLDGNLSEYSITFRLQHSTGKWVWIQSRAKAIFDSSGQAVRMVGAHSDITYLKEYQEFLKREKRVAEQANEAKSEFLAHMSHEIRTPLTAINGIAEIFEKNIDQFTEKQQRLITTLKTSISSLKDLINDILDFSKIESGQIELEESSFNLGTFFKKIVSITSVRANEKDIRFSFEYDDVADLQFYGDAVRLRQVLINLIGNAIKFTNEGSVTVKAKVKKKGRAEYLQIDVIDTGIGIPKEKLEMIFERFKQSDASVSRAFGGTGLGLSISKKLIDIMGGEIKVKSKMGKGSTFSVIIPMPDNKNSLMGQVEVGLQGKVEDKIKSKISDDPKILIVEDYEGNVVILSYLLEQMEIDFDVAGNGVEALEKWKDHHYDAILMDIQMPEMDGFTATQEIRQYEEDNALEPTPIIGMTAHALVSDREKCLRAGMDAYVPKPIDENDLRQEIMTALDRED